jgi:hypothetical protein
MSCEGSKSKQLEKHPAKNAIYIMVGDSFIPNRIFFKKEAAINALSNSLSHRYVLVYVPDKRVNGESKLVARYYHSREHYGSRIVKDVLWLTENTDYGALYEIDPKLCDLFEYDEYDDVVKYRDDIDIDMLTDVYGTVPEWLKVFVDNIPSDELKIVYD